MAGLAFSLQIAAHIAALGLVKPYQARGERLRKLRWRIGPFAPKNPAHLMTAGKPIDQIALFAHLHPGGLSHLVALMAPTAPEDRWCVLRGQVMDTRV
jgi:hypothetical protein